MEWGSMQWRLWAILPTLVASGLARLGKLVHQAFLRRFGDDISEEWQVVLETVDWVLDALETDQASASTDRSG